MQELKNITYTILSKAWAKLTRVDYDYKFKSGEWRRVSRECYDRGNGAAILLYNPEKEAVILTKQFRMPTYYNNESDAMSIEVCAGVIDDNETPEQSIIRETKEEVGYEINHVEKVYETYTSPGALTEKMYLFIAIYNDTMKISNGGGLEMENEEIDILEVPFYETIKMIDNGEIIDAKTIMLLQYVQIKELMSCKNLK